MANLWIYGCSFSEPFGLEQGGPEFDINGHRKLKAEFWGTHLARKLNLTCITRSLSGIGLNYIINQIEHDARSWQPEDIIIISPSFLARVNIMEFENGGTREETIHLYKHLGEIIEYNTTRWKNNILNYQHFGFNIYTWLVDDVEDPVPNTMTAPNGSINWKHWMDEHYEYWTSLPGVVYPAGDWHFNPLGHVAVADRMFEIICKQR